ncbi:MAG: hypothetical protein FWE20_13180, partial [Defluviitaleaceae bacterium]|nr:hypothetical protein [Defluviitaleaceae bacterium]
MPYNVFLFTNPFCIAAYSVAVELILRASFHFLHVDWQRGFRSRLMFFAALLLISTIMNFNILFSYDYKKSVVDASPIANLSREQINRLETVIEGFKDY